MTYWCSRRTIHNLVWVWVLAGLCLVTALAQAEEIYVVRSGDTLTGIARSHGLSVKSLAAQNGLPSDSRVLVGQRLRISGPAGTKQLSEGTAYVVRRNDTLTKVARQHGLTVARLADLNGLSSTARLKEGQRLRVPEPPGAGSSPSQSPLSVTVRSAIREAPVKAGRWKHIIVHHSGTADGSVKGMDAYHRRERHMENGLAYHFVIGNGHGMGDGEIGVGNRWSKQIQGGHLASESLNEVAIGICLVGNFDEQRPTAKQMQVLAALVDALRARCGLPRSAVKTHQQINPVFTRCPGRHLAASPVLKEIQGKSK